MALRRLRARFVGGVIGAVLALAAVGGTALAADHAVGISGFNFSPASVTVAVGDTVTWTNSDDVPHTATADGGAFDTGTLDNGGTNTVTFSTAGTFPYHCSVHPQMTGTVVVEAASSAGGGSGSGGNAATPPPTSVAQAERASASSSPAWAVLLVVAAFALGFAIAGRRFTRG